MRMRKATKILICCVIVGMTATTVCADFQVTFTLENSSNVRIDGVGFGQDLQEQVPSSDIAMLSGTIEAIITYDGSDIETMEKVPGTFSSIEPLAMQGYNSISHQT